MDQKRDLDPNEALYSITYCAGKWHRSSNEIYDEIIAHDYREERGVFFRHLDKRSWRINPYQYLYWRRLPPTDVGGEVRIKLYSNFLLQHLEPTLTALLTLKRYLVAEYEAAELRLEQQVTTDHERPGGGGAKAAP